MSRHPQEIVTEFHSVMGLGVGTTPRLPEDGALRSLRHDLLEEEYDEYLMAEATNDLVEIADALADMVYVIFGTAIEYGIPLDLVLAEVHRSNMSKVDPKTGTIMRRSDGKILKPASYSPPDIAGVLNVQNA